MGDQTAEYNEKAMINKFKAPVEKPDPPPPPPILSRIDDYETDDEEDGDVDMIPISEDDAFGDRKYCVSRIAPGEMAGKIIFASNIESLALEFLNKCLYNRDSAVYRLTVYEVQYKVIMDTEHYYVGK